MSDYRFWIEWNVQRSVIDLIRMNLKKKNKFYSVDFFIQEYSSFYSKITDFSMILVFLGVSSFISIEKKKSHLFILKTMNFEEETSLLKNLKRLQDKLTNNKCSLPIETYNNLIHSSKHVYFLLFPLFTHSSIEWLRYSRILQ